MITKLKTFMVALFAVCRCILYPYTKVVVTAPTLKQSKEVILKITDDFMKKSSTLCSEIEKYGVGQNDCYVIFKNGSTIRCYVASENSRGARSNILIIDEARMIPQKIIDTIFRPMNASPRQPPYLRKPEYAHLQEMNKEMYMSSAWYASSELFDKMKAYMALMLDPKYKYMVCDFPYMLSIKEGLLMREAVENEMNETTFNEVAFSMEREGLFYGASDDALFDINTLSERRVLRNSLHCLDYYSVNNLKIPEKQPEELRILSVDVALLASKKHDNDASALMVHSAFPTADNNYLDNIVFIDTQEGLVTDELGLLVMRYFYQYDCDYIALDTTGIGQSIGDYLNADRYDPIYGQQYGALNYANAPDLEERCKVRTAPKVIYSIKGNSRTNNDMCLALRSGFQNGNINLLISDNDCDTELSKMRGYSKQSEQMKNKLRMPYVQTSMLINELINLTHEVNGGLIKVKERSGMRKDRYSSAEYGYYVVQELSRQLKPKTEFVDELLDMFTVRKAKRRGSI